MTTGTLDLGERLRRYARYVEVVAEQLEALDRGDHERLQVLMDERRELETDDLLASEEWTPEIPSTALEEALRAGLSELEEKCESDRQLRDRWIQISADALRSARSLALRPAPVPGRYPETAARGERLDLRL